MRSLLLKLMDPARKALSQLYRPEIPENARRLLYVRWKLPEEIAAIDESQTVRSAVQERVQGFLRLFFPNLALVITHTLEDPKDSPKAGWDKRRKTVSSLELMTFVHPANYPTSRASVLQDENPCPTCTQKVVGIIRRRRRYEWLPFVAI